MIFFSFVCFLSMKYLVDSFKWNFLNVFFVELKGEMAECDAFLTFVEKFGLNFKENLKFVLSILWQVCANF